MLNPIVEKEKRVDSKLDSKRKLLSEWIEIKGKRTQPVIRDNGCKLFRLEMCHGFLLNYSFDWVKSADLKSYDNKRRDEAVDGTKRSRPRRGNWFMSSAKWALEKVPPPDKAEREAHASYEEVFYLACGSDTKRELTYSLNEIGTRSLFDQRALETVGSLSWWQEGFYWNFVDFAAQIFFLCGLPCWLIATYLIDLWFGEKTVNGKSF